MAETKYGKYIITGAKTDLHLPSYRRDSVEIAAGDHTRLLYLDDEVIKGAFHIECTWYWKGSEQSIVEAHTHPFDEVIAFLGTNLEDPGICVEKSKYGWRMKGIYLPKAVWSLSQGK
jgi:hypothetical protein